MPAIMSEDQRIRVEDYLNDKLQSQADLENLDTLLGSVKNQQELLRKQLHDAETDLETSRQESAQHSRQLLDQVEAFQKQQASIDKRIMIITQSETSDDAVRKFDSTMRKLRKLDISRSYVNLLTEVQKLTAEARGNFKTSPQAALKPYMRLQEIALNFKRARPAAEDAAPHLTVHIDNTIQNLWQGMKDSFSKDFEQTLQKLKWPDKSLRLEGMLKQEWVDGVERLLELQQPELKEREADPTAGPKEPLVLLPLEVMVKPLQMRFRYHFEGDRPTNRLDKPEYFLSHIASLLNDYDMFFATYFQPILYRVFKGSALALNPVYIDSSSALIAALLPMLREKLDYFVPQVAKQPQLLSHLMHELMSFDSSLRDTWGYDGGRGANGWKGITWEVLVQKDWFGRWLDVEKEFALNRYRSIIEAPDSGEIDYESVDPSDTKPTKAAIRVNDLLETVTDRYRPLMSFSQKLRFLIDIQIAIFDRYHDRLNSALEAFLTMTSSIARTVQGISKEEAAQLQGLGGIERLCRIYGSAEYLERKMRDWSDDVFFLELWDELQFRARQRENPQANLAGAMTVEDVAGFTSSVVGSEEEVTGALFDETAGAYRRLRVRTEGILQEQLFSGLRDTLRPYNRINPWSALSTDTSMSTGDKSTTTISAELDATVQLLSQFLGFLSRCLAFAPLRRITRQLALQLQAWLWDHIITRNSFSTSGVTQLKRDLQALWDVADQYCGQGYGRASMPKLADAVQLMSLSMDGGDDENMKAEEVGAAEADADSLSLWGAERRIFRSNEEARLVLEELGLENLSESDARLVMEKRIELGS